MRILAIRGENLASLAGPFEVDMEAPPLGDSGLFCIVGPTGAGKSTLLDAMCLALFDRTPRMSSRGGPEVGGSKDDKLKANDVRSLLTRGRGSGHAEVDFVGLDGRRYRARWSVRRARNRPGGRFQPQEMSLRLLEDGSTVVAGRKEEVKRAIRERLGLGFEQFRRSVLLAQGDFAAFLHANEKDRADLLERMTGTDLYARISRACFERAKQERDLLAGLHVELDSQGVKTPEERAELEQSLEALRLDAARVEEALAEAMAAVAWHQRRAELERLVDTQRQEVARARERIDAARPLEDEVSRLTGAMGLVPLLDARERATAQLGEALDRLEQARVRDREATEALTRAEEALGAARQALGAHEAEEERLAPELSAALDLDARVDVAERELMEAGEASREAEERLSRHEARLRDIEARRSRLGEALRTTRAWLEAHPREQALLPHREEIQARLGAMAAGRLDMERLVGAISGIELAGLEARVGEFAADLERAKEAVSRGAQTLERVEAELAAMDRAGLLDARRSAEARASLLREAIGVAKGVAEARQEIEALGARLREHQAELSELEPRETDLRRRVEETRTRLDEARRAADLARAAMGLAEHRALLVEGRPCPLCGSERHPWASEGIPSLGAQEQRVQELTTTLDGLQAELAGVRERRSHLQAQEGLTRETIRDAQGRLSRLEARWPSQMPRLDTVDPVSLEEDLRVATAELERLDHGLRRAQAMEAEVAEARAALDRARRDVETSALARDEAMAELERARDEIRGLSARRLALEQSMSSEATRLEALGLTPDELGAPSEALESIRAALDGYEQAAKELQTMEQRTRDLDMEAEVARQALTAARDGTNQAEAELKARREALTKLRDERAGLLGGRTVADVRAELGEARARLTRQVERAQEFHHAASEARSRAAQALRGAEEVWQTRRESLAAASAALEERLAREGISVELVERARARGRDWLAAKRAELDELHRALHRATTLLEEREDRLREHLAGDPGASEAEARAEAEALKAEQGELTTRMARIRADLDRDDEARRRAAALRQRCDEQGRVVRTWESLSELIGSADGSKFRKFAQGLTLQTLLGHANQHLASLTRRYEITRIPGYDLELQVVDHDLGDEVRSIKSLSGGESFLVSLALALGLASMSSVQVPIGSLFIDEGFGSLDRESLEVALAALDALQATGRQVGIISHVEGLDEHIGSKVLVQKLGGGHSKVLVG